MGKVDDEKRRRRTSCIQTKLDECTQKGRGIES
jgi:hypothetical protein